MRYDLSPKKNFALLVEAFWGTRAARDKHSRSVHSPITVQSGLAALRARWPDLWSSNQSAPVFIFSAGWRSGSTFLQRWMMTDESILLWGEPYCHANLIPSLARQLEAFTQSWPPDDFFADRYDCAEDLSQAWVANLYPSLADFMNAHIAYFEKLFLEPARTFGKTRWGLKEVTLGVDHACYLQWLFPNARFLFLYRDPYHAYSSYRKWRDWYRIWPSEPVFTATRFGAVWRELAADFVENHSKVGGLLLRYEELQTHATRSQLEDYLGFRLGKPSSLARVDGTGAANCDRARSHWTPKLETFLLKRQVEPVSAQLGYRAR